MGQHVSSLRVFDPSHVRIYKHILEIQTPATRIQMIQTVLAGQEYMDAAKRAGVYSHLLAYVARVRAGERPAPLPGERVQGVPITESDILQVQSHQSHQNQQLTLHGQSVNAISGSTQLDPHTMVAKGRRNEKAMNYFQNCLLVLGLEEEVALTEDLLRSAYKRAAVKAHPDKGGSEQAFEAVTRANAYLTDILRRIQGGRAKAGVVEAPEVLKDTRSTDAKDWQHVEPVRLNPKKLDLDAFNKLFEQTRIPDPDDDGYGDWLKTQETAASGPTFGGKFNRDYFNSVFEDDARKRSKQPGTGLSIVAPQAMTLAPTHGVELGRSSAGDYTAPANASVKYTDLRKAYTTLNTFSGEVANVAVESRSFDQVSASRKAAPKPLADHELAAIQAAERQAENMESQRRLRAAQEMKQADDYFQRMKQMVLTDERNAPPSSSQRFAIQPRR